MEWVWTLYQPYVARLLEGAGPGADAAAAQQEAFVRVLSESTATVLVQEPWRGSVRFKGLARYAAADMMPLLNDPEGYLHTHFGGGKFKVNFHHGWHFVATQNFKPSGEPLWREMDEIDF